MENTVQALARMENTAAVQKAIAHYDQQMSQKAQLPTETVQELLDLHRTCEREARDIFLKASFKDEDRLFQKELMYQLEERWKVFCKYNADASSNRCRTLLQDIFRPLEEGVKQGTYSKPGGYAIFSQDIQNLKQKYLEEPRKGIQAEEVLNMYLQSKDVVVNAIFQIDKNLTEKEQEIEVEHIKAEFALSTAKLLEETQRRNEQLMQQKEKTYREYLQQLTQIMENDRAQLMEEQRRMLSLKLQEQEKLLQEGFKEESRKFQEEISNIEKRHQETMNDLKAESLQSIANMMIEKQKNYDLMLENKDKRYQEDVKQLIEKMERDAAQLMVEQERTMALKFQEEILYLKKELSEEGRKNQRMIQDIEMKNKELNLKLETAQAEMKSLDQKEKVFVLEDCVAQLIEKMELDKAQLRDEFMRTLACRLKGQEDIFNKKLEKQSQQYYEVTKSIKKERNCVLL